ncbi:protein S40-6 [Cryptomeria japonica]|uniref:protein S40-6 n=1 Tax=Cryptomeria japonica TaxID=3369 RepID=UPI0027DA077A|nr:protein S40-6 [Cryptomeria japonica]
MSAFSFSFCDLQGFETMASHSGREGLLSRSLAAVSNRMERLVGLSSHYSFASAGENSEELREEDVWLAGGADEDFGDEKKKTKNYFHLQEDFGDENKKATKYFHLQEEFGDEKKKMKKYFHSGKNSASIVRLSDGLGISGLSVAFEDPATRSRDVSFISSSRVIPCVETPDVEEKGILYQSAPVNVPDWTKILGIHHHHSVDRNIFTVDDDDMDEEERLPPHEYLAREHARSHVDATSVLEGVGRKLKGRDLSRVRNAVWNQTGFLG